jgi:hypothetical protein
VSAAVAVHPTGAPVRVSVLAVLALWLSAGTALLVVVMFWGAGCVAGIEASGLSDLIVRDAPVYHTVFSWAAVVLGGGAQTLAVILALWSRHHIRRSAGRLAGGGVAIFAIVLAVLTLAAAPVAFACGAALTA